MALLRIQAGRGKDSLVTLDYIDNPRGTLSLTHTHTSGSFYVVLRKNNRLTLLSFWVPFLRVLRMIYFYVD